MKAILGICSREYGNFQNDPHPSNSRPKKNPICCLSPLFIVFGEGDIISEHVHCCDIIHTGGPFLHMYRNGSTIPENSRMVLVEFRVIPDCQTCRLQLFNHF